MRGGFAGARRYTPRARGVVTREELRLYVLKKCAGPTKSLYMAESTKYESRIWACLREFMNASSWLFARELVFWRTNCSGKLRLLPRGVLVLSRTMFVRYIVWKGAAYEERVCNWNKRNNILTMGGKRSFVRTFNVLFQTNCFWLLRLPFECFSWNETHWGLYFCWKPFDWKKKTRYYGSSF